MSPSPDTILAHPALSGRTIHVRRGRGWETYLIQSEGALGRHPEPVRPDFDSWRTSTAA